MQRTCVFFRVAREEYIIIVIHVDDMMNICKKKGHIESIRSSLKDELSIKDLGNIKYCLGLEFHRKHKLDGSR